MTGSKALTHLHYLKAQGATEELIDDTGSVCADMEGLRRWLHPDATLIRKKWDAYSALACTPYVFHCPRRSLTA
jgi:hypothetical protein